MIEDCRLIGAGVMGDSIALAFALHDIDVRLYDVADEPLARALAHIADALQTMVEEDFVPADRVQPTLARIHVTTDLTHAVADRDYVLEVAPEALSAHHLPRRLDNLMRPDAILAVWPSSLALDAMAGSSPPSRKAPSNSSVSSTQRNVASAKVLRAADRAACTLRGSERRMAPGSTRRSTPSPATGWLASCHEDYGVIEVLGTARQRFLAGSLAFALGLFVCVVIKPDGLRLDFGISYYGNFAVTVVPYTIGLIATAIALWSSARTGTRVARDALSSLTAVHGHLGRGDHRHPLLGLCALRSAAHRPGIRTFACPGPGGMDRRGQRLPDRPRRDLDDPAVCWCGVRMVGAAAARLPYRGADGLLCYARSTGVYLSEAEVDSTDPAVASQEA